MVDYIRSELTANRLSYPWLQKELAKRGVKASAIDLSHIFGPKAEVIIDTSASIIKDYKKYASRDYQ